jgi:hypothetical protein
LSSSIKENESYNLANVAIFPNPTDGNITINLTDNESWLIEINNYYGQVVKRLNTNEQTVYLDLNLLPSGIYFVKISNGNKQYVKKLVKNS